MTDELGEFPKAQLRHAAKNINRRSKLARPRTATSIIHEDLRREIINLSRKPCDVISEKEIAAAYGVSRTPVREAILKLVDERLVEIFPQSGTYVAQIPVSSLAEAILVRTSLERLTTRLATERHNKNHAERFATIMEDQRRAAKQENRDAFHNADEAFHEAIAIAAGHPGIWRLVQSVKFQVDRYRRLTLPAPGRMHKVINEHEAVLNGIKSGNVGLAETRMVQHLEALASFSDLHHINPIYLLRDE